MPLHVAQMNELETKSPETWRALKEGDFSVKRTGIPFTNLFVDQALEQKIRELKVAGGITGVTQNESALNRFLPTAPELTCIVNNFQHHYLSDSISCRKEHYQLTGMSAQLSASHAAKIKACLQDHCVSNPFATKLQLVNIVSRMAIPDNAKDDILNRDKKGEFKYR